MSFPTLSREVGFRRDMLFALELLDPVSMEPVWQGMKVEATGLEGRPVVNLSGRFVWLVEKGTPLRVKVDPQDLLYEPEDEPAPMLPARLLRIVLRPRPGYDVAGGVTAVSSSVYRTAAGPNGEPVGVSGVQVWLEFVDARSVQNGPWIEGAGPRSQTSAAGDFLALLRFAPGAVPGLTTAQLRARLRIGLGGAPLFTSPEFLLPQGRKTDLAPFAWDPP